MIEGNLDNLNILENKNKNKFPLFLKFFIFLILFFIFLFFLLYQAPNNFSANTDILIQKGDNLRDLSSQLKDKNVIRSRFIFESFFIFLGGEKKIIPGKYSFEKKMSVFNVANFIFSNKDQNQIKITIPEGYDREQIAFLLQNKLNNFDLNKFLLLTKDLEGQLFPDTYFFFISDTAEEVILVLKNNFDLKIKKIKENFDFQDKNLNEVLIMASLIEREAEGDSDRALIAGILWNRIKIKMPLQVDAWPWTYKNKGLPEKPICNPGLKAIEAVLKPLNSNYLYYLHDKDGNIYYALTYTEHKKNINKYLRK